MWYHNVQMRLSWGWTMPPTPDFVNPPIVELVLGAQFSPLPKLTAGHFGLFWNELGPDWTEPGDGPLIEDQFELFDRPWKSGNDCGLKPDATLSDSRLGTKARIDYSKCNPRVFA